MLRKQYRRGTAQRLLSEALDKVENDPALSAAQKLSLQARITKDWEAATGRSARGYANRTPLARVFGMAFLRTTGRELARGLFRRS